MIIDFIECEPGKQFRADVCIVGAGAAGITLAREFLNTNITVLLLEGGGRRWEEPTQRLYDSEVTGKPHAGIHSGRARIFGGTTTLWAGQTLPLDEIVFENRPWMSDSGWPIKREELDPFYRRAEQVLHVGPLDYHPSQWPYPYPRPPQLDEELFELQISQFSPQPNFGAAFLEELEQAHNITVILHANATRLTANEDASAVTGVEIRNLAGRRGTIHSRYYLISCGAIETARLMLASDDVEKNGLGNRCDLVGRYFQDHVQARSAAVKVNGDPSWLQTFEIFYYKGLGIGPRFALSSALQRERQVLNAAVAVNPETMPDANSPVEAAKRVLRAVMERDVSKSAGRDIMRMLSAPHQILEALYRRFVLHKSAYLPTGNYVVGFQGECEPCRESRVALADTVDALGMRRARLDWKLTPLVRKTAAVATELLDRELRRLGLGELDIYQEQQGEEWTDAFWDVNHHMGTCRMHSDPARGVVNSDCRVHTVDNLFIASCAVFPTSGYSNPTFTMLALTIRLADHIKRLIGTRN